MFSKFFIDRPRFAIVICVLMAFSGMIAAFSLPIEQYPNVTPPQIQVTTTYRGGRGDAGQHGRRAAGRDGQRRRGYDLYELEFEQQRRV